jgi:multisubunit Na+/H+ antiporter MnhG subunit
LTVHVLLVLVMIFCWLGVLGMWRMREPMQALHYLSLPACGATVALTAAVFFKPETAKQAGKLF